jgi:hypothetical protein
MPSYSKVWLKRNAPPVSSRLGQGAEPVMTTFSGYHYVKKPGVLIKLIGSGRGIPGC